MLSGILSWLTTSALGTFLKELAAAVLQGIQQKQARADQIALGQQRQITTAAVTALQIQEKMQQVAVQPHDVATAVARLNAQSFDRLASIAVAGCAPRPDIPSIVTAPVPVPYTCEQQRQANAELATLPPGSMLGIMMGDYPSSRDQAREALKLPKPEPRPG